jgi:cytochrome b6-f complex iron-sulfur subunit
MNRAEFLRSLELSSATLMAMYCMGGLTACSNEGPQPDTSSGTVDFTLDLNETANSIKQ